MKLKSKIFAVVFALVLVCGFAYAQKNNAKNKQNCCSAYSLHFSIA